MASSDGAALVDLWIASWREAMPWIDFEGRRDWIEAILRDCPRDILVADDGSGPMGFMGRAGGLIHQLVVAPRAKGSGVATRLLDAAKAAEPGGLTLDVNQDNFRAVRFYVREGFVVAGAGVNATSGLATWAMRWPGAEPA